MTIAPPLPSLLNRPVGFDLARLPRDFGDWRGEARACRNATALFDFSCLLTLAVEGPAAQAFLETHCARDLRNMPVGAIRYALTAAADGHLVSDLTLWRSGPDAFLLMSGRPEDIGDLERSLKNLPIADRVILENRSEETYVLALQGPAAMAGLTGRFDVDVPERFTFAAGRLLDESCIIGRIGYTGEDGVEILCARPAAERLWERLVDLARPSGFRAANLLRLEAGLPLFTHEFAPEVSAAEAGFARIRRDLPDCPSELQRIRAFARPATNKAFQPATTRPARGEMSVTSAMPWGDGNSALLMGYVHAGAALTEGSLQDPSGRFGDIRPIPARGLLT